MSEGSRTVHLLRHGTARELTMTNRIFLGAFSVALVAGVSGASAQTVIVREPALAPPPVVVTQPVAVAPVETVETVRTVSTDDGARRVGHRRVLRSRAARVTTTRTVRRERIVPQPGYDTVDEPIYDVVPGADVAPTPAYGAPAVTVAPAYQYIYEPDRILVVDPVTGIAVQSIPR
jgi:hypothetical protein